MDMYVSMSVYKYQIREGGCGEEGADTTKGQHTERKEGKVVVTPKSL